MNIIGLRRHLAGIAAQRHHADTEDSCEDHEYTKDEGLPVSSQFPA